MKLLSSYIKEMKIAARGYYFYIELVFAIILLMILLFGVDSESVSKKREFLFYNMAPEVKDSMIQKDINEGKLKLVEPTEFKMKEIEFDVTSRETGEVTKYKLEEKLFNLETYELYDTNTGKLDRTLFLVNNEVDMIRLSFQEKSLGITIITNGLKEPSYRYYLQGYETEKLINLILIIHNETTDVLEDSFNSQVVRKLSDIQTLNIKETLVPIFVVFMGSLMGFFIVVAYIFLDKTEGVIKAFVVTPSPVWKYMLSKTMVIITTVCISSSIITIPIMGLQPNYLLFYLLIIISTFTFSSLGLLLSSFFDSIQKAFVALYFIMIAMMLPVFSYVIPSFDPVWLRVLPTYPMLQGIKEIIMVDTDTVYVLTYSGILLTVGILLFLLANYRFKKTLTV